MSVDISFLIPCYNSELTINTVIDEIHYVMNNKNGLSYEIITVNDCSPDNVMDVLRIRARNDDKLVVIGLAKNSGKHAAIMAGLNYCRGEIIVNLDDDGQCPINCLDELIEPLNNGYDISIAKYSIKKESFLKRAGSSFNEFVIRKLLSKPKELSLGNFSAIKSYIAKEIIRYKNPYPYIDGLYLRSTSKITNVEMEERERICGKTNYTLGKSISLWLNGFTAFSVKPLRISSLLGVICAIIGFIFGIFTIFRKLFIPNISVGWSSTVAIMLFIGGLIMLMLGMIGEYIGRIYISINNSPQYVVRETINVEDEK